MPRYRVWSKNPLERQSFKINHLQLYIDTGGTLVARNIYIYRSLNIDSEIFIDKGSGFVAAISWLTLAHIMPTRNWHGF